MSVSSKEIDRALAVAFDIPGMYRREEAEFMYRLARRKGNFVELGCWMGRTTAILLQAASVWGADLTSVDAFTPMPAGHARATEEQWRENLCEKGLRPPRLLSMTTDKAAEIYEDEIAFLFIDANHNYKPVARDLANWTPKIKAGGIVALHDMFYPSLTGVATAVAEWWRRERIELNPFWELVGLRDITIAFRRRPPVKKVFDIGLSKTGAHSLLSALKRLGYRTRIYPPLEQVLEVADEYDALVDTPTLVYMEELDKRYPDALFILTIREIDSWLESCRKHWARMRSTGQGDDRLCRVYGIKGFDEDVFRRVYHEHHKRVRGLFGDRPGKLLEMNIAGGDGYETLCPALNKTIIYEPFPHKNAAPEEG